MSKIICTNGSVIENYDRNEAARPRVWGKEWSVLVVTNPRKYMQERVATTTIPSKQDFAARFVNIDPFQHKEPIALWLVDSEIRCHDGIPC